MGKISDFQKMTYHPTVVPDPLVVIRHLVSQIAQDRRMVLSALQNPYHDHALQNFVGNRKFRNLGRQIHHDLGAEILGVA